MIGVRDKCHRYENCMAAAIAICYAHESEIRSCILHIDAIMERERERERERGQKSDRHTLTLIESVTRRHRRNVLLSNFGVV